MRILTSLSLAAAVMAATPHSAAARNILITNDDGLTSNVVALHAALAEAGHDVIVSVPCRNQSGMGAAIRFAQPLAALSEPCHNGAADVGAPAAGPMTRPGLGGDFFYVDGTPVMALLYGLDVVAERRWGGAPDIVLSGPNEGQNVGAIILSSGTVSAAQYAAVRGLPAVALSAGSGSRDAGLDGADSATIGALSADLVRVLENRAGEAALLPNGIALNVNFPDRLEGAVWRASEIGDYNAYRIGFTESMSGSASPEMIAAARERGQELPDLPGLSFTMNASPPTSAQEDDESVVYKNAISVSPMRAGYDTLPVSETWLRWYLSGFVVDPDQAK